MLDPFGGASSSGGVKAGSDKGTRTQRPPSPKAERFSSFQSRALTISLVTDWNDPQLLTQSGRHASCVDRLNPQSGADIERRPDHGTQRQEQQHDTDLADRVEERAMDVLFTPEVHQAYVQSP
jgi:hypothetical protein